VLSVVSGLRWVTIKQIIKPILTPMKKQLLLLSFSMIIAFCCHPVKGQAVEYSYDAVGNRISRAVIVLKSALSIPQRSDSIRTAPVSPPEDSYEALFGDDKVIIRPNPTRGYLLIDVKAANYFESTIAVYDLKGNLLFKVPHTLDTNSIDFTMHPAGVYILKIQIGDKMKEWKIIKE
jgi:hypothetical protein